MIVGAGVGVTDRLEVRPVICFLDISSNSYFMRLGIFVCALTKREFFVSAHIKMLNLKKGYSL